MPRQRPGVSLRRKRGIVTLREGDGSKLCVLNDSAAAIWELCDGKTTAAEIAKAVSELCGVRIEVTTRDVDAALEGLRSVSALDDSASLP